MTDRGDIVYSQVVREDVRKLETYVEEIASGDIIPGSANIQKVQDDALKLRNAVKSQPEINQDQKNRIKTPYDSVVRSVRKAPAEHRPRAPASRSRRSSLRFLLPQISNVPTSLSNDKVSLFHLKQKADQDLEYSSNLTSVYLDVLNEIALSGTTFKDKNALLTGVGKASIGVEIVKGLLSGGAHVVITTPATTAPTSSTIRASFRRLEAVDQPSPLYPSIRALNGRRGLDRLHVQYVPSRSRRYPPVRRYP